MKRPSVSMKLVFFTIAAVYCGLKAANKFERLVDAEIDKRKANGLTELLQENAELKAGHDAEDLINILKRYAINQDESLPSVLETIQKYRIAENGT